MAPRRNEGSGLASSIRLVMILSLLTVKRRETIIAEITRRGNQSNSSADIHPRYYCRWAVFDVEVTAGSRPIRDRFDWRSASDSISRCADPKANGFFARPPLQTFSSALPIHPKTFIALHSLLPSLRFIKKRSPRPPHTFCWFYSAEKVLKLALHCPSLIQFQFPASAVNNCFLCLTIAWALLSLGAEVGTLERSCKIWNFKKHKIFQSNSKLFSSFETALMDF